MANGHLGFVRKGFLGQIAVLAELADCCSKGRLGLIGLPHGFTFSNRRALIQRLSYLC
jgi:hypothetical protein